MKLARRSAVAREQARAPSQTPYSPITRGSRRIARLDPEPLPPQFARAGHGAREPNRLLRSPVLKRFLSLTTLAATLALAAAAAPASAGTPCWKVVISDWYADGRIDGTYPISCYEQAKQNLPDDVATYADAADEIQRAMLDRLRHQRDEPGTGGSDRRGGTPLAFGPGGGDEPPKGLVSRLIDKLGPSNADSVPLPLLVLAGIAFLLLAAAAGSFVARRIQARRVLPAPASAEGPRDRS
jgi:hypothetical protein